MITRTVIICGTSWYKDLKLNFATQVGVHMFQKGLHFVCNRWLCLRIQVQVMRPGQVLVCQQTL